MEEKKLKHLDLFESWRNKQIDENYKDIENNDLSDDEMNEELGLFGSSAADENEAKKFIEGLGEFLQPIKGETKAEAMKFIDKLKAMKIPEKIKNTEAWITGFLNEFFDAHPVLKTVNA